MSSNDPLSGQVIDAAIAVHRALGPGLLESAYEIVLTQELRRRNLQVERQVELPITYQGIRLDAGYRLDLLVNRELIVELKCVESLLPIHEAQLISYLRLSGCTRGLLINFHVPMLKDGIKRLSNGYLSPYDSAPSASLRFNSSAETHP